MRVVQVTGLNDAADYATSPSPPSVTYDGSFPPATATDELGRTTTFTYAGNRISSVSYPSSTAPNITVGYDTVGKVASVVGATGTWAYTYATSGTTQTTTAAGPLGQQLTVVSDLTFGRATSVTDALSHTTTYSYDSQRRLQTITQPEGNGATYAYDGRGNVTQVSLTPKIGSSEPPIITSAIYPTTCTSAVTCSQPTSTTDPRGSVTNYTYDTGHGGLLTATSPAPTTGADRPQTRLTYGLRYAWYRNALGVVVQASTPVTVPLTSSACAAGVAPACVGTAAETRTILTYDTSGAATNLLPGAGDGSLTAVTTMVYNGNGDICSVEGPLSATSDLTAYRYTARERIGVVGPDPDGGGALRNRTQRITYDARGQVGLVETGTTAGYSDADWAGFTTLQRQVTEYDGFGRPVVARAQGSTGVTQTVSQVAYDTAGRPRCSAQRMNLATFSSFPATGACTAGAVGTFGPDRIVQNAYDAAGRPTGTTDGVGTTPTITESVTYTANGRVASMTDGAGSISAVDYDVFDRPVVLRYPLPGGGGASTTDFQQVFYDVGSNPIGA